MVDVIHSAAVSAELHVPGYIQSTDPLTIGAGKMWVDTSGGAGNWVVKLRNAANSGWEPVSLLDNNVAMRGKSSTGTSLDMVKISSSDQLVIGSLSGLTNGIALYAGSSASAYLTGGSSYFYNTLAHQGNALGFYNVTPVARPAAYTQTYATVTRTHPALTSAVLTGAFGSTGSAIADATASHSQTILNNNFRVLEDNYNLLRTDVTNLKNLANQIIDDLQAVGLLQ